MGTVPTILGDLYLEDQGTADQPVALLWPSLFTDHSMWHNQVPALRKAGFRTLVIDPPGHGRSPGLDRGFTIDECAKSALQVLDAANVSTAVVVLGTSWGGMIAPRMALFAPDRVRGMVLFNTTAESASPYDRAMNTFLTKLLKFGALDQIVDRLLLSLQLAPVTRRNKPEIGAALKKNWRSWERRGLINTVRAVLVDRDSSLDALRYVKAPALIVSGKQDTILPSPHSRRILAKLAEARHVEVDGASHLVPLEAPETANTLILNFVAQLPRA
jgi:3-oxoadipate enol-lactonase